MSRYKKEIENFGEDVNDFEAIPFESIRMMHDRSELHKVYDELTFQEKLELARYDLQLIQNAKKMVEHMSRVYDFSHQKIPEKSGGGIWIKLLKEIYHSVSHPSYMVRSFNIENKIEKVIK